ncbi:MAG: DEAD/DEAH box helicase family protein [Candidatus Adiutrix sp.]|jgi:type III restriction enzyme|nr:DEAD/DEAH box helicase family protein [Candidatus Adiutrix sp.]
MSEVNEFFERPILNSPYEEPTRHWLLDGQGQPTQKIKNERRRADFITPIPKPRKMKKSAGPGLFDQADLSQDDLAKSISIDGQGYDLNALINKLRHEVGLWCRLPREAWKVTPETATLLNHWRSHEFNSIRPFFCQIEAVETAIWLTEVAPKSGKAGQFFLDWVNSANEGANPGLNRLALKLATGAGKTTVMAMLIAWQTINAARYRNSKHFTTGFLVVAPGITIKDRLQVLRPNDPNSYYIARELVPPALAQEIQKARVVITNYHAFKLRDKTEISAGGKALLTGKTGEPLNTLETPGQMIQRVMPELMGLKNIVVFNDEAHHCYREKPLEGDAFDDLSGAEKTEAKNEAKEHNEAARLWISGLEMVQHNLGLARIFDLSATPFFLRGSGYTEGTLFPWTLSDFSLMDAIECGIVKLPRVPVAENIPGNDMPMYRNLWDNIRNDMPKKGRGKAEELDPLSLPVRLCTALDALYGHYEKTYNLWAEAKIKVPPCFIVVCNNTSTSKLVYDYISGFERTNDKGDVNLVEGRQALFRNFDEHGEPLARPHTILIDSEQLESGDILDDKFRAMAGDEIERFKREIKERGGVLAGDLNRGKDLDDATILREVMNTVGKPGTLGDSVRCVVSVSMLTEGWDANTVTHILGVRAFGTQLLCEQVVGRALRRQSYDLNEAGLFNVEYADVLGIPFDFTATPIPVKPQKPSQTVRVRAMRPDRDHLEITFPRVMGYRVELPSEKLTVKFTDDSILELTPELVGPTITQNSGIIGESVDLTVAHLENIRTSTIIYNLTQHLLNTHWRDPGENAKLYLFGQLKSITRQWLDECLVCKGDTKPAQLMYKELGNMAAERITAAITLSLIGKRPIKALLDPYNHTGSTNHVNFTTSKSVWETNPRYSHLNNAVQDSDWEGEFCRVAEGHPKVRFYVKNQGLGFEVPYKFGSVSRHYLPDFIVRVDDGHGEDDLLNLIVEVKGYRKEDAKEKKLTMQTKWLPGVNNAQKYGRWAFAEFLEMFTMGDDLEAAVRAEFDKMIELASSQIMKFFNTWDNSDVDAIDEIIKERETFASGRYEL